MPQKNSNEENPNAFKLWINAKLLKRIGQSIVGIYPAFDLKKFEKLAPQLDPLELKPRVRLIRDELQRLLPADYEEALQIIVRSIRTDQLQGFDLWPYAEWIQTFGLEYPKISLDALAQLTTRFTAEFAVRPFIRLHQTLTMQFLEKCARSHDVHLRRWASEGSRPRLPWGEKLTSFVKDPGPGLKILEILKNDPELYVRKSISNHLNDIAKDNPDIVLKLLKRWKNQSTKPQQKNLDWIIKQALRTLIKNADPQALALMGVSSEFKINFSEFKLNKTKFSLNERIEFSFVLKSKSKKTETLIIDYIIHYQKSNGTTSKKVFKLKSMQLGGGTKVELTKRHHLKPVTTRVHYSGLHYIEVQINGKTFAKTAWHLKI